MLFNYRDVEYRIEYLCILITGKHEHVTMKMFTPYFGGKGMNIDPSFRFQFHPPVPWCELDLHPSLFLLFPGPMHCLKRSLDFSIGIILIDKP